MGLRNQNCQGILDILTSVWTKYILQKNLSPECFSGRKILRFVHSYLRYLFSFPGMPFSSCFNSVGLLQNYSIIVFRKVFQWSQLSALKISLCALVWLPRENTNKWGTAISKSCILYKRWPHLYFLLISLSLSSLDRPENAASAESTVKGVAKAGQANENCSQSIFRSVTEISSAGDRTSGFGSVDVVYFVPFLLSR